MKNVKFNASELLDSLNRELNQAEINEIYKALTAYGLGLQEIDEETDKILDEVIDNEYYEKDYIRGIVNEDILDIAEKLLEENMKIKEELTMVMKTILFLIFLIMILSLRDIKNKGYYPIGKSKKQ